MERWLWLLHSLHIVFISEFGSAGVCVFPTLECWFEGMYYERIEKKVYLANTRLESFRIKRRQHCTLFPYC